MPRTPPPLPAIRTIGLMQPMTWLVLAWLRLPDGDGEAGALARLAMRRDPADQRLSRAARSITDH